MLRFIVLSILFAVICAVPIDTKTEYVNVTVVHSIDEYLTQNPNIVLFEQLEKEENQDRELLKYTLGQRVDGEQANAICRVQIN